MLKEKVLPLVLGFRLSEQLHPNAHSALQNSCHSVGPSSFCLLAVYQCPFLLSYLRLREAAQLCHVFTSFLLGLCLFTGDEALFAAHLLFLEVSEEERLWRKRGMHHLKE